MKIFDKFIVAQISTIYFFVLFIFCVSFALIHLGYNSATMDKFSIELLWDSVFRNLLIITLKSFQYIVIITMLIYLYNQIRHNHFIAMYNVGFSNVRILTSCFGILLPLCVISIILIHSFLTIETRLQIVKIQSEPLVKYNPEDDILQDYFIRNDIDLIEANSMLQGNRILIQNPQNNFNIFLAFKNKNLKNYLQDVELIQMDHEWNVIDSIYADKAKIFSNGILFQEANISYFTTENNSEINNQSGFNNEVRNMVFIPMKIDLSLIENYIHEKYSHFLWELPIKILELDKFGINNNLYKIELYDTLILIVEIVCFTIICYSMMMLLSNRKSGSIILLNILFIILTVSFAKTFFSNIVLDINPQNLEPLYLIKIGTLLFFTACTTLYSFFYKH